MNEHLLGAVEDLALGGEGSRELLEGGRVPAGRVEIGLYLFEVVRAEMDIRHRHQCRVALRATRGHMFIPRVKPALEIIGRDMAVDNFPHGRRPICLTGSPTPAPQAGHGQEAEPEQRNARESCPLGPHPWSVAPRAENDKPTGRSD